MISISTLVELFGFSPFDAIDLVDELTPKEKEVAMLVALGHDTPGICKKMNVLPKTVNVHKDNIRKKWPGVPTSGFPRIWFAAELGRAELES